MIFWKPWEDSSCRYELNNVYAQRQKSFCPIRCNKNMCTVWYCWSKRPAGLFCTPQLAATRCFKLALPTFSTKGEKIFSQPDLICHGPDHENLCRGKVSRGRRLLKTFLVPDISTFYLLFLLFQTTRIFEEERRLKRILLPAQLLVPRLECRKGSHQSTWSYSHYHLYLYLCLCQYLYLHLVVFFSLSTIWCILPSLSDHCLALLNSYLVP